jgi:hypothetical protein
MLRKFDIVSYCCFHYFLDQSESNRDVTHLSVSEDDDSHNLTTDLSDISDAEESSTNNIAPKNYIQRMLPADQRVGSDFEKYSNEITNGNVDTKDTSNEPSVKALKNSTTTSGLDVDQLRNQSRERNTSGQHLPQARPKIWSISEIISPKSEKEKTSV